jgi:NDP-sugar pyrophosphorylase family protein
MAIKQAYILAAGKGTRMGDIGMVLPKILWPAFGRTLLDWQIYYLDKLGIEKIFINVHHCSGLIKEFISRTQSKAKVFILEEEVLLGSGGAIHNLLGHPSVDQEAPLLLINGDQFLFLNESEIKNGLREITDGKVHLFCIPYEFEEYNQVVLKNARLIEIIKGTNSALPKITFSGVSLLNLKKMIVQPGVSSFFDSVADYKVNSRDISATVVNAEQYIDFGTLERYAQSHLQANSIHWQSQHQIISNFFSLKSTSRIPFKTQVLGNDFTFQLIANNEAEISYKGISLAIKIPAFQA